MMTTLADIRGRVALILTGLAALHVPLLASTQALRGDLSWPALAVMSVMALAALIAFRRDDTGIGTQLMLAAVLIGQVSMLVFSFSGHPWQPDLHMYYFAVLALLAGFCDWRPIMLGAALTALHHLVLQYLLPSAVFYQGGSLARVLLHAGVVVIETTFLASFAVFTGRLFAAKEIGLRHAQDLAERQRQIGERERQLAEANGLRAHALQSETTAFRRRMDEAMATLDRAAEAMLADARSLTGTAAQARAGMTEVSETSDQTMRSIGEVADASDKLVAAMGSIGRNASRSVGLSKEAAGLAGGASEELARLVRSSESIGKVVEIIRAIAAQTSMLALNATIEAARAGEAGRGFAVVAGEVKTLSAQTARATDEVADQIGAIQTASQRSLKAMREIFAALSTVEQDAEHIAGSVHHQDHATSEIARQLQISSEGARRGAELTEGFEAITQGTHEAAERLQNTADTLATQAQGLRAEIGRFCASVAAA